MIKIGAKYKHYKGGIYEVVGIALHSETGEELVIYKALYEGEFPMNQIWARPISMWSELIIRDEVNQPRFAELDV